MTATSGRLFETPLLTYDPDTHSLRTSGAISRSGSIPSSPTLPPSGSMRSGACWEAPTLAGATDGNGSGSLLPTPTAQAAKHSTDDRGPGTLDDFNLWSVVARMA